MVSYAIRAVGPHLVRAFPAAHLGFPESVLGCRGRPRIMGLNPRLQRGLGDPTIETDIVGAEWAAEVQYVHMAEKLFDRFMTDSGAFGDSLPALVTGLDEAAMVPDDHINDLRAGIEQLEDYPAIATFLGDLRHQVLTLGTIDESKLMKGPQAVSVEL